MEKIDFPEDEYKSIKDRLDQNKVSHTIRIKSEWGKYKMGNIYATPWGDHIKILSIKRLQSIRQYVFYNDLTNDQKNELSQKDCIEHIVFKKVPKDIEESVGAFAIDSPLKRNVRFESFLEQKMDNILIDFDKVIHSYHEGWQNGYIYGFVIDGAKESLTFLKKYFNIIIFTARASEVHKDEKEKMIRNVEDWLRKNEIPFDLVTADKMPAFAYIDDKAINFDNWKNVIGIVKQMMTQKETKVGGF